MAAAPAHLQPFLAAETTQLLMVDVEAFSDHEEVHAPVASKRRIKLTD